MIEKTTEIKTDYPSASIIWGYTLYGSYIGGMIAGLYFAISDDNHTRELVDFIKLPFMAGFTGIIVGFIPACLTGIWISVKQLYKKNIISYIKLFFIGFFTSFLFYSIVVCLISLFSGNKNYEFNTLVSGFSILLGCGVIGGLSSVIIGSFVVPKQSTISESTNNDSGQ